MKVTKNISLQPEIAAKLEKIRQQNYKFNLSAEVGKMIENYYSKHVENDNKTS